MSFNFTLCKGRLSLLQLVVNLDSDARFLNGYDGMVGKQLMEIEVNGVKQMSGVKITKCRYVFFLQSSFSKIIVSFRSLVTFLVLQVIQSGKYLTNNTKMCG
jgi:hypothetical protein